MDSFNDSISFSAPAHSGHVVLLNHIKSQWHVSVLLPRLHLLSSAILTYAAVATLLACAGWLIFILFIRPKLSPHRHLPSPDQGWAMFGLLHEPNINELEHWIDTIPNDGLIRYFGLWNEERLFATSPDAVKDLLVKQPYAFVKPHLQFVLADNVTSTGLLILEGDVHRRARKAFNTAFNAERVDKSYPVMLNGVMQLVDKIAEQTAQDTDSKPAGQTSILRGVSAASVDIFGVWGLSRPFNALAEKPRSIGKAYIELLKTTKRGQLTLDVAAKIGPELALKLPLRAVKTMRSIMSLVRQTAEDVVAEHEHEDASKDDMLQVLINSNNFSHKELVDEVVHFLAAATETTAGSIVWGIHLLSRHRDMQSRLREEIHTHIPSIKCLTNDNISATLERMPYLNAVIRETLRFHSMNTILWRQCVSSTATIRSHHIPIGTKVTFSPWALQRDPAHWGPDARTFNPERWLLDPISGGADHSYSFLNFGAGPRRCIGETYAKVQMRCMFSALIGAFEWAPIDADKGSDVGEEIGDNHALTLFKILEGWKLRCVKVDEWL
ncbi:hypothetical protein AC579_7081 [Pseudocercospora musae]|uniref:Cytochrome P450 n=1 Tax=Pseudocercospora musae TaxID=113226 RepID=A0A139HLQ3_9PEZI|nr:hypothetical protein AC579_7081 [Pseudocercospora musae]